MDRKVTVIARTVLSRRRVKQVLELPSPADVERLTCHLVIEWSSTPLKDENYRRLVVLAKTRLLLYNNIDGIPRNACGASRDISIWYSMCMIAQLQGVKEKHMSPYIEYESPVCFVGKLCSESKLF